MQDFIVEELLSRFNVLLFLESDKDQSLSNIMQCEIPMHFFSRLFKMLFEIETCTFLAHNNILY